MKMKISMRAKKIMYTKELFTVSERTFPLMSIVNNVAEIIDLEPVLYQHPILFAFTLAQCK